MSLRTTLDPVASPTTLSDSTELHARLHDLSVVALRTRGRQRDLIAAVPGPSAWAGPAAVAYTSQRLTDRAAAIGHLADSLDAVAGQLGALVRELPALALAAGVDARSPVAAVRQAQRLLTAADAAPGPIDGVWGPSATTAVARVQSRAGLTPTGVIDGLTAMAISAAAAGGAVAVGGAPGVARGLLPLAGSHPVAAPAPADPAPTEPAPDPMDSTADPDPGDPTADGDPGDPGDPTGPGDPAGPGDPTDGGTTDGDDPLPPSATDPGPAVDNLIQRLTPPAATTTPAP